MGTQNENSLQADLADAIAAISSYGGRAILKALVLASISIFVVLVFTGEFWKAVLVSIMTFVMALFSTWRRYLEPIGLMAFVVATIFLCAPLLASRMLLALASH